MKTFAGILTVFILLAATVLAALYIWDIQPFSAAEIKKTAITGAILFAGSVVIFLAISYFLKDPTKGYNQQVSERVNKKV